MNPLYQQLYPQQDNILTQIKQNPYGILSRRYNLPQNLNNPNDILQYLLNTNQVSQQQVNAAMQTINNPTMIRSLFNL